MISTTPSGWRNESTSATVVWPVKEPERPYCESCGWWHTGTCD